MSRWIPLSVMMTFFALLPLDLNAPTLNLCIMALVRWSVISVLPDGEFAGANLAGERVA
ncbi:hypothetical protein [uncultured Agrobacterium sp.]|uniref:hypothetical protein n=1 Tax=uncultured Agrobacterium sp. TaxID=157277 RepID=UPI0025DE4ADD|nr:hypothetical protein [uncultured Agrobacterium sp.]